MTDDIIKIANHPSGRQYQALVVDDSGFVQKQLTHILQSSNVSVLACASDGQQALDILAQHVDGIDIITLDITMQGMDGIETLQHIMHLYKNISVIMISALGREDLIKKALMLGAKSYIIKPLDRNKVIKMIQNIVS